MLLTILCWHLFPAFNKEFTVCVESQIFLTVVDKKFKEFLLLSNLHLHTAKMEITEVHVLNLCLFLKYILMINFNVKKTNGSGILLHVYVVDDWKTPVDKEETDREVIDICGFPWGCYRQVCKIWLITGTKNIAGTYEMHDL